MVKEKILEKLGSIFKEEIWGRIEPKDIGISKFKILDDLFNTVVADGLIDMTIEECQKHLDTNPDSITASYLLGLCGYHTDTIENTIYLRKLIDVFMQNHKWAVAELISEKVLEYGENSVALRALATSLERLGRNREAIPILESLLKIDRFDADVSKKLASAIIDDEPEKSIHYMKLSIEGFIKNKDFDEVSNLWNKLVSVSWEDITFFERIERLLVEAKQQELAATLIKVLLNKYRDEDNPDQSIELLKKILEYRSDDSNSRRDLIKLYKIKYGEHSQFDQFVKLSKLNNFRTPVKYAIQDFEKNIVFDKGNYAFHNSWKLGKIEEIDSDHIVISFKEKPDHKMSIQMALQSLVPIPNDHLYVIEFEDPDMVKNMFKDDFIQFFEILIKSYEGTIVLADIKRELIPKYVDQKSWAKWWSKARTKIKKDPLYGVSEKKKDLIFMRDKPVTFSEELLNNFIKTDSFSEKFDVSIEFVNNIEKNEGANVAQYFIDYYLEEVKGKSTTRQVLSYFMLKDFAKFVSASKLKLKPIENKIVEYIKSSPELPLISVKIGSYDYKKDFVNLIEQSRGDWANVLSELLFETPVRIHKYIINILIRAKEFKIINNFIEQAVTVAKTSPDIFIWVAKNLLIKTWDYDWLDYSRERLVINFFRLMNELKKIEIEGNRLKNISLDILFDNEGKVLSEIVKEFDQTYLRKLYDIFINVSYIEEWHSEKFHTMIKEKYADFQEEAAHEEEDWELDIEKLIVSQEGYEKMKNELNRMVNEEMVTISKELSKVSEVSADMRENVEYNALMEKQAILKMSISKLDDEMKKADVLDVNNIDTDSVNVGTKVVFQDIETKYDNDYTILGPWDADFAQKILSYRSPIAKSLLGKKIGEEVELKLDDDIRKFEIKSIQKYS